MRKNYAKPEKASNRNSIRIALIYGNSLQWYNIRLDLGYSNDFIWIVFLNIRRNQIYHNWNFNHIWEIPDSSLKSVNEIDPSLGPY